MSDDVCDSWEDVDVDKIVIKSNGQKKPTYSSILSANKNNHSKVTATSTDVFDSNFDDQNGPFKGQSKSSSSSIRIMQRIDDTNVNEYDSPFTNQPKIILDNNDNNNTRNKFVGGLRILNRPNNNKTINSNTNNADAENIQEKLKKSFQEKQAEYAKARLRILGECLPNEDLQFEINSSHSNMNKQKQVSQQNPMNNLNIPNYTKQQTLALNQFDYGNRILRQPIGPDGTRGFHRQQQINNHN